MRSSFSGPASGVVLTLVLVMTMASCGGGGSTYTPPVTPPVTPSTTLRSAGTTAGIVMGAAADPSHLSETNYANTLSGEYRLLEPENAMKFGFIHPRPNTDAQPYDYTGADQLVNFATANNMLVRGHCFVWHQQVPDWVTNGVSGGAIDATQLGDILHQHIQTVGSRYAGKMSGWDVVNEAFNDDGTLRSTIWYNQPGIGLASQGTKYIEQAFVWAHAADPNAKLFYNDYSAEAVNAKSDAIYAMAQDFKARGVPLDGIGFQLHVGLWFDNPGNLDSFARNMKRFSDLGMEVQFTELDIALDSNSSTNLTAQAALYKKITQVCVQTPNCKLIQTWGFTDKYSWLPWFTNNAQCWALPFDENYAKKPAYQSIVDALQGK